MNMFVAISTYQKPLAEVDAARDGHLEWVGKHYDSGNFLVSGRQASATGGVIVAQADSESDLLGMLSSDPFVISGLSRYELIEFSPTAAAQRSPGFIAFSAQDTVRKTP